MSRTKRAMNQSPFCINYLPIALLGLALAMACSSSPPTALLPATTEQPRSLRQYLDTITQPISPELAMLIAETFVVQQGYTDQTIDWHKQPIQFEKGEYASDTSKIIQLRRNTLSPQAIGVREYGDKGGKWLVGFKPINGDNNIVRAVTMDSLVKILVMQAQNVREDWVLGKVIE